MYFLAIVVLLAGSAHSQRIDDARLREAERLYLAQEYHQAIDLLSVSGLFGAVPVLDRLGPEKRAGLLFDVSRLQYASGDGERAEKTLAFLFGKFGNGFT